VRWRGYYGEGIRRRKQRTREKPYGMKWLRRQTWDGRTLSKTLSKGSHKKHHVNPLSLKGLSRDRAKTDSRKCFAPSNHYRVRVQSDNLLCLFERCILGWALRCSHILLCEKNSNGEPTLIPFFCKREKPSHGKWCRVKDNLGRQNSRICSAEFTQFHFRRGRERD